MIVGVGVEPVLCSCGCGDATNAVVIEAQRLRDENGESWASASTKLGVSYAYIKTIRKNPAKSLRGHNRLPTSTERPCVVCGKAFFSSLPPEKMNVCSSGFCTLERWKQRRAEWADNNARMREVWRHRQLVKDAAQVRLRARRLLRRLEREREAEAARAWRAADRQRRIDYQCQHALDRLIRRTLRWRRSFDQREQRQRRRDERRIKRAFVIGRQRDGIRHVVPRATNSEDAHLSSRQMAYHGDEWNDDVFEEVADRIDVDEHQFFAFAKQAAFVPEDFYQRCRDGELCLVVDDDGIRFLARRGLRPWDVVPWEGNPVVGGFGGSRGRKSSRHRGRHAASAATRGRRSAKQSKTRV